MTVFTDSRRGYDRGEVGNRRLLTVRKLHPHLRYSSTFSNLIMSSELKVAVIGGGNWGTTIAKICGHNVQKYDQFHKTVRMYVYEEMINGKKLTEIINTSHENVKYLPGKQLPPNVVAVPDVVKTAEDADILIFVLPHQFVKNTLKPLIGNVKPTAIGITLIKGFDISEDGKSLELFSKVIHNALNIEVNVLMGANLAGEIASEKFCETTIGCRNAEHGVTLKRLIETPYFKVVVVDDVECVEACGALKNIVACGAGFADGLKCGDNTKAAIIRLGIIEMIKFTQTFYTGSKASTMLESCGVADVITSSYGGRNRKVSEAFVLTKKTIAELEVEMLNGQRLQGPETAAVVYHMLKTKGLENSYPLFTAIHLICIGQLDPAKLIECISDHPIYMRSQSVLLPERFTDPLNKFYASPLYKSKI